MTGHTAFIRPVGATGADVAPSLDQVREFIRASKAENTLRGYQSDWRDFCEWCEGRRVAPLPALPETVAAYIANCAGRLKVGSIQRRLNAITEAHKAVGLECAFAGQEVGFCAKFVIESGWHIYGSPLPSGYTATAVRPITRSAL